MAVTLNDGILMASLVYSCVDLQSEWELFDTCQRPIHRWLLVSYACMATLRLLHLAGAWLTARQSSAQSDTERPDVNSAAAVEFLVNFRQKGKASGIIAAFSWLLVLPFFVIWTLVGTAWLYDVCTSTPECVPSTTHLYFTGLWIGLCYTWIFVQSSLGGVAYMLERRVRRAETNLREVVDADTTSRWGSVSTLSSYASLPTGEENAGLTPGEIRALPETIVQATQHAAGVEECECAICLTGLDEGERVRCLPTCGHTFHRACIDLWLLRRADCPLCKQCVRGSAAVGCAGAMRTATQSQAQPVVMRGLFV